jgi:hypothetical protein
VKEVFQKHRDWWKWAAAVIGVILPSVIVMLSNRKNLQDDLLEFNLMTVVTIGASLLIARLTDMRSSRLWIPACIFEGLLALGLVAQLVVHFYVLRDSTLARHSWARYEQEKRETDSAYVQDFENYNRERARQERERSTELERDRERGRAIRNLPWDQRDKQVIGKSSSLPSPTAPPTRRDLTRPETPEDVVVRAHNWFLGTNFWEIFIAIFGVSFMGFVRSWDRNKNQVPDWIEQLPEEEIKKSYPAYAAILFPKAAASFDAGPPQTALGNRPRKPPSETALGNRPKPPSETALGNRPRKPPSETALHRPDGGSCKGRYVEAAEGNYWEVLGRSFPDLEDVRYTGKKEKLVIEVRDEAGNWLGQIGKRDLLSLDLDPQRSAKIVDKIKAMRVRASEKEFGN